MSQSPITKFFRPDSASVQSKHRDSPRPATSADNLVCHTLKRLQLYPECHSSEEMSPAQGQEEMSSPRCERPTTYTFAEKMDALEQAFLHGFTMTSRKLNIPCSTLSTWKKELVEAQGALNNRSPLMGKRRGSLARKLTYSGHADDLAKWLSELKTKKKSAAYDQMKARMRTKMGEEAFQAKSGWLSDFMTKHSVTVDPQTRQVIADTDRVIRDCSTRRDSSDGSNEVELDTPTHIMYQEGSGDVQVSELESPGYHSSR